MSRRLYLAGPMSGYPAYNFTAFSEAAKLWAAWGYEVHTPFAANSRAWQRIHGRDFDPFNDVCDWGDPSLNEMMVEDLADLCRSDAVAVLAGWEKSKGARAELVFAINLGKPIYEAHTGRTLRLRYALTVEEETPQETILQEAQRLVHGNRRADYGHPADDYGRTGRMWGAILGLPDIDPRLCALMMAAMKISRDVNKSKRDNRTDLAGYAECADMIAQRQETR